MKKLFVLPVIGLVLGMIAIATEIKANDLLSTGQQLSSTVVVCIKGAINTKETVLISDATTYQNGYVAALAEKKIATLAAWDKLTKKDITSALTTSSKTYKKTIDTLKKSLKTSQKSAQSLYKTQVKACKATGLGDLVENNDSED